MTIDTSTLLPLGLVITVVGWGMISAYAYGKMVGKIEEMEKRIKDIEDRGNKDFTAAIEGERRMSRMEANITEIFKMVGQLVKTSQS